MKVAKSHSVKALANRVLSYLQKHRSAFFSELAEEFEEFRDGDLRVTSTARGHSNVVLWVRVTEPAVEALKLLQERGAVRYRPLHGLEMLMHGSFPNLPTARRPRHYKTPRWLPVAVEPTNYKAKGHRLAA